MTYNDALSLVKELTNDASADNPVVIAIDGRAASSKTTFALEAAKIIGAVVLHTDDFFRPRNKDGELEIAPFDGNFDVERFKNEAVSGIMSGSSFEIGLFDCQKGCVSEVIKVPRSRCYIVEGSYSHNPKLGEYATIKLFFSTDVEVQKERILQRNGREALERFLSVWIPAEECYFKHYEIIEKSDYYINN